MIFVAADEEAREAQVIVLTTSSPWLSARKARTQDLQQGLQASRSTLRARPSQRVRVFDEMEMGYEQGFEEGLPESTQADDFSDYTEPQDAEDSMEEQAEEALESGLESGAVYSDGQ